MANFYLASRVSKYFYGSYPIYIIIPLINLVPRSHLFTLAAPWNEETLARAEVSAIPMFRCKGTLTKKTLAVTFKFPEGFWVFSSNGFSTILTSDIFGKETSFEPFSDGRREMTLRRRLRIREYFH